MSKLLIVEDNEVLGSILVAASQRQGHQTDRVSTCSGAQACLETKAYDLVIVDRGLPDGDGLSLVRAVRDLTTQTKVMIVSYKNQVADRVSGFEHGADDYLIKPFDWTEWRYRVQRLLSVKRVEPRTEFQAGGARFSPETNVLTVGAKSQILRRKEAQVLECLWRYKNQVVTKDKMVAEVWTDEPNPPADVTLEVYVRRLRMRLGSESRLIGTVRGVGYVLRDNLASE